MLSSPVSAVPSISISKCPMLTPKVAANWFITRLIGVPAGTLSVYVSPLASTKSTTRTSSADGRAIFRDGNGRNSDVARPAAEPVTAGEEVGVVERGGFVFENIEGRTGRVEEWKEKRLVTVK